MGLRGTVNEAVFQLMPIVGKTLLPTMGIVVMIALGEMMFKGDILLIGIMLVMIPLYLRWIL